MNNYHFNAFFQTNIIYFNAFFQVNVSNQCRCQRRKQHEGGHRCQVTPNLLHTTAAAAAVGPMTHIKQANWSDY